MKPSIKPFFFGVVATLGLSSLAAWAATFNQFSPANGVLVGNADSPVTTSATSANIRALWSGTCDALVFLRGDGACSAIGGAPGTLGQVLTSNGVGVAPTWQSVAGAGVSSVGLSMPAGFSVSGSPIVSSGTLSVTTSLSGLISGSAGAFVNAAASDVTGEFSGTCNSGTYLRGDGQCQTPPGTTTGANPTGLVGLTANNGVAGTYTRSDGTPALSQAISPTWSGTHAFNNAITVAGVSSDSWANLDLQNTWLLTSNSNAGQAFINSSTGTLARNSLSIANSARDIRVGVTSTGFSGSAFTGAPAGEAAFLYTPGSLSLTLGSNNTARLTLGTAGDWSVGGGVGTSGQVLTSNGAGTAPSWQAKGPRTIWARVNGTATCSYAIESGFSTCTKVGAGAYSLGVDASALDPDAPCVATSTGNVGARVLVADFVGSSVSVTSYSIATTNESDSNFSVVCYSAP